MKKIVWIVLWPLQIYTDIAEELAKEFDITLIVAKQYQKEIKKAGYQIHYLESFPHHKGFWNMLNNKLGFPRISILKNLEKTIASLEPDLVVANTLYSPATWQCKKICRKNNIMYAIQTEIQQYSTRLLLRPFSWLTFLFAKMFLLPKVDYLLPWTTRSKKFLKASSVSNPMRVLAAGLPKSFLGKPRKARQKLLSIARFVPYKNHKQLIEIVARLPQNYSLTLVGTGPLRKKYVKRTQNNNRIHILEHIPHDVISQVYDEHDFFLLPSKNEAIGMVVLESMARGVVPLVSSTAGAITYLEEFPELICSTTQDYIKKVQSIATEEYSEKLITTVKNKYTTTVLAKTWGKTFQMIIGGNK